MSAKEEGLAVRTGEPFADLVCHNNHSPSNMPLRSGPSNPADETLVATRLDFSQFEWLTKAGVAPWLVVELDPWVARGRIGDNGLFVFDPLGRQFLTFVQGDDMVFWQPRTNELASFCGLPFALGEELLGGARVTGELALFSTPLDWLRKGCRGIVVLDWSRACQVLSLLRHIDVPESLLPQYQAAMFRRAPAVHLYSDLQVLK